MSVMFHSSFALNRKFMAGVLSEGLRNEKLKDKELAKPFGYGTPFAARYRSWLNKCGVTEMGLPFLLTKMGEVVVENDPKFESNVSKWFLHHELVTDPERAEAWHFFAMEFLHQNEVFSQEDLLDGLTEKLRYHSEMHFGPGSKLNKTIRRKILEVYTSSEGLGDLGIIRKESGKFRVMRPRQLGPWKTPAALSKAFHAR